MLFKTKGFIEPKGSRRDFEGDFFGIGSTSIRSTVIAGQTEGLRVGCGGMGGWRDGYQYIYCLPPAGGRIRSQGIIIACLRQVVAFAAKVIIIACLRQGFCIRKTR